MVKKKLSLKKKIGSGIIGSIVNKAIDLLPVELHIPGYSYCGPGTKLSQRLKRGDLGINKLDQACREHDIAYNDPKQDRTEADKKLAALAWERVKSPDASIGERSSAYLVTNLLNAKTKFGGGLYLRPYKGCGGVKKKKKNKVQDTLKPVMRETVVEEFVEDADEFLIENGWKARSSSWVDPVTKNILIWEAAYAVQQERDRVGVIQETVVVSKGKPTSKVPAKAPTKAVDPMALAEQASSILDGVEWDYEASGGVAFAQNLSPIGPEVGDFSAGVTETYTMTDEERMLAEAQSDYSTGGLDMGGGAVMGLDNRNMKAGMSMIDACSDWVE